MNSAKRILDLSNRGLEIAEAQYNQGLISVSDLIDLELEKSNAETIYNKALRRLIFSYLDLKIATSYFPELDGEISE
jgi:outer membrane protein TolC